MNRPGRAYIAVRYGNVLRQKERAINLSEHAISQQSMDEQGVERIGLTVLTNFNVFASVCMLDGDMIFNKVKQDTRGPRDNDSDLAFVRGSPNHLDIVDKKKRRKMANN